MARARSRMALVLMLAALASLGACPPATQQLCQSDRDCDERSLCYEGVCRRSCNSSAECVVDDQCAQGICLPRSPAHDAARADAAAADDGGAVDRGRRDASGSDSAVADRWSQDVAAGDHGHADGATRDTSIADSTVLDVNAADRSLPDIRPDTAVGCGQCTTDGDPACDDLDSCTVDRCNVGCCVHADDGLCPTRWCFYAIDRTIGANRVVRACDRNGDGDALDPDEQTTLFDVNGGQTGLGDPYAGRVAHSVAVDPAGNAYVIHTDGRVLRLHDTNRNGVFEASESTLFYRDTSVIENAQDLVSDTIDSIYVASANPVAQVVRLIDLDADGDAMDAQEAVVYSNILALGLDMTSTGKLYTEGSYLMQDLNADGDALDPDETIFYGARSSGLMPLGVAIDPTTGLVHVQHRGLTGPNEITLLTDLDSDGDAADTGEQTLAGTYVISGNDNSTSIQFSPAGILYTSDAGGAPGIWELVDSNHDGVYVVSHFCCDFDIGRFHRGRAAP